MPLATDSVEIGRSLGKEVKNEHDGEEADVGGLCSVNG